MILSQLKPLTVSMYTYMYVIDITTISTACVIFTDVYLSLNGDIIPNHGYVVIGDIGSIDNTALLCHTNKAATGEGDWFAPDGDKVGGIRESDDVPGFGRNRGDMVVRLQRNSGTEPEEGIYHCVVKDVDNIPQTVYVGLFNSGGGNERLTCCNAFALEDHK